MLFLDLGTLRFCSHVKMDEKAKNYLDRKTKGMDSLLRPDVVEDIRLYLQQRTLTKSDQTKEETVKQKRSRKKKEKEKEKENVIREELNEDTIDTTLFYDSFSLDVTSLHALMLRTSMDYSKVHFPF
jgi:hypothetical protein